MLLLNECFILVSFVLKIKPYMSPMAEPAATRQLWVVILSCLWFTNSQAIEVINADTQYRVTHWKTEDGLPQNRIQSILQTGDGYLWFGTHFGIARFDGVRFTIFDSSNTPEMVNHSCSALAEDRDGNLWIATQEGLLRRKDGQFTRYTKTDGLPDSSISQLCASRSGGIWIGTKSGLGRFQDGKFSRFYVADGLKEDFIRSLDENRKGILIVATSKGLQQFDATTRRFLDFAQEFELPDQRKIPLLEDQANNLWVGTDDGLHRLDGGRWTTFNTRDGLSDDSIRHIREDRTNGLWVVTRNNRLNHFQNGRFTQVNLGESAAHPDVLCAYEDREGNLWLGTTSDGLIRLQPTRLKTYTTQDGLTFDDVWSVCEGRDGGIWVGTGRGLSQIQAGRVTSYASVEPALNSPFKSVLSDRTGTLWIGVSRGGLFQFKDGRFTNYNLAVGLGKQQVQALYEDRGGNIWIGSDSSVIQYKNNYSTRYTHEDGMPEFGASAILEDHSGNLWFGSYGGGLCKFRDGKFTVFTTRDGLSNNRARSLHEDADGVLWIGTERGLNRFKGGRFFAFTTKEGLFDNLVNHVLEDDFGNFWISCNRGIYRVSRRELNDVAEGKAGTVRYAAYGEADGMLSSETKGETQPAGWRGRDGQLWFPTTKGLVVIDPKAINDNKIPPPMVIEQVLVNDEIIFGDGAIARAKSASKVRNSKIETHNSELHLAPGRVRVMEIHYTANSFVTPEKVRFQYRLEGYDLGWREAGQRRVAIYTDLQPGDYRFHVIACNNHGYWNSTGATFALYVTPGFYQTWTFYILCGVALCGAGFFLHVIRVAFLNKFQQLEQEHALEQERARIAQDMHDDLGANLTKIAILSEAAKKNLAVPHLAESQLERISSTAGEVLDNLGEIIWAMNHENDTLDNLCAYLREYAAQSFELTSVNGYIDFPANVPSHPISAEFRRHVFLLVKEGLHNIVKHSGAMDANLMLTLPDSRLEILIADNGRGFTPDKVSQFGNGLQNMRQRVTEMNGTFDLQSQPGLGTQIKITISL